MDIVTERNGKPITTSLKVAEKFEKDNKHVLESIRNLVAEKSVAKFFRETTYKNIGKKYPMFEIGYGLY